MKLTAPTPKPIKLLAIHANLGVEAEYKRKLQALIKEMSAEYETEIAAAWKETPLTASMAQDASLPDILTRLFKRLGRTWSKRFDDMSVKIAESFANEVSGATDRSMMSVLKKAGFAIKFKPTPRSIEAYQAVLAENVGLIKSIPAEYLKGVQADVWQSVTSGYDLGKLTETLKDRYGVTHRRAAFIATDQNNKAKATIEKVRRLDLGITEAVLQHSGGGKHPRYSHLKKNGTTFKIAEGFYDSAIERYVQPGELPNCRCTSRAIIPGFEDQHELNLKSDKNARW